MPNRRDNSRQFNQNHENQQDSNANSMVEDDATRESKPRLSINELTKMGAKTTIEGRTAVIKGVRRLSKSSVRATDLRGGAALVIAALNAKGRTYIDNIEYILRGYENLDVKLKSLGANIFIEDKI